MKKRVLCLLFPGFEEIEAISPIDLLRRGGVEVIVASLGSEKLVKGRSGIAVKADTSLDQVAGQDFDLLFIPGGPGVKEARADGRAAKLAEKFFRAGKQVAAICAAPTILQDAGVLGGKRFTSHSSVVNELPQSLQQERVVEDGNLVTSRGAGTAVEFGIALVRRLCGEAAAADISKAIMA